MANLADIFGKKPTPTQETPREEVKPTTLPSTVNPFAKVSQTTSVPAAGFANPFAGIAKVSGANSVAEVDSGLGVGKAGPVADVSASGAESDLGFTLAGLDVTNIEPVRTGTPTHVRTSFPDEIPATAPARDVPIDSTREVLSFVELIDNIYTILDDPEMLSNVIRNIMIELKSNPQYMNLVTQTDVRTWVIAMRNSMGLAQVKKTEAKVKRATGGARKSKAADADLMGAIDGLGINFDDL